MPIMPSLASGRVVWLVPLGAALACAAYACQAFLSPLDDQQPPAIVVPAGCDINAEPKDSPLCVADDVGVFVDGRSGNDSNPGTKAKPYATIGAALKGVGIKPRVYVCGAVTAGSGAIPYDEDVRIGPYFASLYGGFVCADWSYSAAARPNVGHANIALAIASVTKPIVIADLQFLAKTPVNAGDNSIAASVYQSPTVTFEPPARRPAPRTKRARRTRAARRPRPAALAVSRARPARRDPLTDATGYPVPGCQRAQE